MKALHNYESSSHKLSPDQGAYAAHIININVLMHYVGDGFVRFATCATCALSREPPTEELLVQQDFAVGPCDEAKCIVRRVPDHPQM